MTAARRDREWFRLETAARLAGAMAALSTCRRLRVGCVIVSPKLQSILAVGYNGPMAGTPNDSCTGEPSSCGCVHAEANALVKLGDRSGEMVVTHSPCRHCAGMIVNSGRVSRVTYVEKFRDGSGVDSLTRAGVPCVSISTELPSVVVIGERRNGVPREVDASAGSAIDRWRAALCEGAFTDETSTRKLASIGVDLTAARSANLLPPSPVVGEWDRSAAAETWEAARVDQPRATWLVCGRRCWEVVVGSVGDEFGETREIGGSTATLIPYPSGLNRWWNSRAAARELRSRLRRGRT